MYLDESESIATAQNLAQLFQEQSQISCAVFPNTLAFAQVRDILKHTALAVGAQNVSWVPKGAYTGATSAELFRLSGASHALVGHSERRYIFGETDDDVRKKIDACVDASLVPVVCIGETKSDREELKAAYRVKKQIMKLFEGLRDSETQILVAYEPVWAIGTGDACDPDEALRMISLIKEEIARYYSATVPVLYGGSVDEKNVDSYLSHGNIDGVLVGSASADATRFLNIIKHSVF